MRSPTYANGRESARSVCGNHASDVIRTFEYLMHKYCPHIEAVRPLQRRPSKPKPRAVRKTVVTREEHDRIFRAYHTGNMTQAELAARFGRSKSAICAIVNQYHKFSSTHDQKTD